jgi:hypothetical protein
MELDLSRGRVVSANFWYSLTPDELRGLVSDLRRVRNGLERWIVPCLEHTMLSIPFREGHPATYAAARELLESCRDLPVADHWKRVRAAMFANAEKVRVERDAEKASGKADSATAARKPRGTTASKRGKAHSRG